MTNEELLSEGARILEQQGWLLQRMASETLSHRLDSFAARCPPVRQGQTAVPAR